MWSLTSERYTNSAALVGPEPAEYVLEFAEVEAWHMT